MLKWFRKILGGETPQEVASSGEPSAQEQPTPQAELSSEENAESLPSVAEVSPELAELIKSSTESAADQALSISTSEASIATTAEPEPVAGIEIEALEPTIESAIEMSALSPAIEEAVPAESEPAMPEEQKKGFFSRLRDRLTKTTESLVNKVRIAIRLHGKVDEELLEEIEEILLQSDVGVPTTMKIVERMRKEGRKQGTMDGDALLALFKDSIEVILREGNRQLDLHGSRPMILLMVGVNGTGKTTTIGKLAQTLSGQGKLVMMVAADTFRAAAADQLQIWAQRTGSCIVRQGEGADPAAVVYEALEGARQGPTPDVILIDTAGRLHTKINLMEELKKIVRVIKRFYPEAPHETILVLDATTGQNAVNQVRIFHDACDLSGLIMTKLDGTAKGGILIACKDLYNLPIFKIGIGEGAEDLRDFEPREFVDALFGAREETAGRS